MQKVGTVVEVKRQCHLQMFIVVGMELEWSGLDWEGEKGSCVVVSQSQSQHNTNNFQCAGCSQLRCVDHVLVPALVWGQLCTIDYSEFMDSDQNDVVLTVAGREWDCNVHASTHPLYPRQDLQLASSLSLP